MIHDYYTSICILVMIIILKYEEKKLSFYILCCNLQYIYRERVILYIK